MHGRIENLLADRHRHELKDLVNEDILGRLLACRERAKQKGVAVFDVALEIGQTRMNDFLFAALVHRVRLRARVIVGAALAGADVRTPRAGA